MTTYIEIIDKYKEKYWHIMKNPKSTIKTIFGIGDEIPKSLKIKLKYVISDDDNDFVIDGRIININAFARSHSTTRYIPDATEYAISEMFWIYEKMMGVRQ